MDRGERGGGRRGAVLRALALVSTIGCSCAPGSVPSKPTDTGTDARSDTAGPDTAWSGPARVDLGGLTPRSVVVIHVDTLRADTLPFWGGERDTIPNLARRPGWIAIERTVSNASWTAPASASLLTGDPQYLHGVRYYDDSGANYPLAVPSYATHLADQGVATALITGSQVLTSPVWGLEQGFDYVKEPGTEPGNAAAVVDAALTWVDTLAPDARFLLFLQPMDMHEPYRPEDGDQWTWADPADVVFEVDAGAIAQQEQIEAALAAAPSDEERARILEALRATYDEQMLGLDRAIDTLLDALAARGRLDDTLVVLTADHGQSFDDGLPAEVGHGGSLRHELVSVPLLFWGTHTDAARVPCLASNMDVFPTITDAMGLPPLDGVEGSSLLAGCRSEAYSAVYESVSGDEQLKYIGVESLDAQVVFDCVRTETQAFDLAADPRALVPLDAADVPGGEALTEALRVRTGRVMDAVPGLACAAMRE